MYEPQSFRVMSLEEFLQSKYLENPKAVEEYLRQEEALRAENPTSSPYDGETTDEYVERLHVSDTPDHFEGNLGANIAGGYVPQRHPNSARFHELLRIAGDTHDRKQTDYGKGDDPFANVRASEEWGVDGWVGAMVRLTDKVRRLQSLRGKGYLANESALDSFLDIAVYALIAYVLYEQQNVQPF